MQGWRAMVGSLLAAVMLVPTAGAAAPEGAPAFSDVEGHWAQEEIQRAVEAGWVDGYPDGTFRPEQTITRAEFTKMLLDAIHVTPGSAIAQWMAGSSRPQDPLEDMAGHWLTQGGWLETALVSGMVVTEDYNHHNFRPEKPIARYEIALMTTRALGQVEAGNQELDRLDYTDDDTILPWMKGYVRTAVAAGVLQGYPDGAFRPHATSTRAEAVVMLQRMLAQMEEGVTQEITVKVTCENWGNEETVTLEDPTVQVVDGLIYVSAQDLIAGWDEAALDLDCTVTWDPITQRIDADFGCITSFQSGIRGCSYEALPRRPDLTESSDQLIAPARMLYGQVMLPVGSVDGQPRKGATFYWSTAWNGDKDVLTVPLKTPWRL